MASGSEAALLTAVGRRLQAVGEELPTLRGGMPAYLGGGKRLRARLLIGIGLSGGAEDPSELVRYATFVELVHAGGLCHDDVVDRSVTRRGRPSVVHLYGARAASGYGLYLMARAFECVATAERVVRGYVAEAASRVARGQAREMTDLYREDVSMDEYLARASDKTAALFELAARLGAVAGGLDASEHSVLAAYGAHVGLAFQLADDLRDIVGGPALGREAGTDIREGVYTLPVLLTLAEKHPGRDDLRQAMRRARRDKDSASLQACCEILRSNGALGASADIMRRHVDAAGSIAAGMRGTLSSILTEFANGIDYGLDDEQRVVA